MPLRPTLILPLLLILVGCDMVTSQSNVKISQVPAHGLTESAFDQGYLQALSEETRAAAEQRLVQAYERNNIPPHERFSHAETQGRYETVGNYRLAVIDLSYNASPMRVKRIVGIAQDQLITISCISPQGKPLDIHAVEGECAEAVKGNFKTSY
ncbi:MAG: hypothetical protein KZQ80_00765 [Candidatus Thiodiazotropha sp. (ex Monitilora ramsayi)]|nr:hypothetical protein [Candidatus Thiodiazotropha sp. (ex Monitilora ramsayi)]